MKLPTIKWLVLAALSGCEFQNTPAHAQLSLEITDQTGQASNTLVATNENRLVVRVIATDAQGQPWHGDISLCTNFGQLVDPSAGDYPRLCATLTTADDGTAATDYSCEHLPDTNSKHAILDADNRISSATASILCTGPVAQSQLVLLEPTGGPFVADGTMLITIAALAHTADGAPLLGERVRYEVIGPALLEDTSGPSRILEVSVDSLGLAAALLHAPRRAATILVTARLYCHGVGCPGLRAVSVRFDDPPGAGVSDSSALLP